MLRLNSVSFTFPGNQVRALDGIDLSLEPGRVQAIIGENGAGKTTLAKLCTGHLQGYSGSLLLDGQVLSAANPQVAIKRGLALVPQHPQLAPELTLWQNLALGAQTRGILGLGWFSKSKTVDVLESTLADWGMSLPLSAKAGTLDAASIHWAVIAEALLTKPRWLFLDEPSAAYAPTEVARLYALLHRCAQAGMGIAIITHRLQEVIDYCDTAFVLRKGRLVGTINQTKSQSHHDLMLLMFGESITTEPTQPKPKPVADQATTWTGLKLSDLRLAPPGSLKPETEINLEVPPGQICGIVGLKDQGLEQLEDILSGMAKPLAGSITFKNQDLARLRRSQWAYIPGRRFQRGIAVGVTIIENAIARWRHHIYRGNWLRIQRLREWVRQGDAQLLAKPGNPITSLSGGMIQRLIFQRELERPLPELVIAAEPFWGLDRRFQLQFKNSLQSLSKKGITILLLLSELDEAIEICDRIEVMHGQRLVLSCAGPDFDRARLAMAMVHSPAAGRALP